MGMDGHGKQILKENQRKLPSLCTCSRYGKEHMISHQEKREPIYADITCISCEDFGGTPYPLNKNSFIFLFNFLSFKNQSLIWMHMLTHFFILSCLPCNSNSKLENLRHISSFEIWSDLALWVVRFWWDFIFPFHLHFLPSTVA